MTPTRAEYAKIHIAVKELGLTDENYRDILMFNFGVHSAKGLSAVQVDELLNIFRQKGWKPRPRKRTGDEFIAVKPGPAAAQQRKVLALWHALGFPMAALHTRCRKQFRVDRFEWLTDHHALHVLITDLERRLQKREGN